MLWRLQSRVGVLFICAIASCLTYTVYLYLTLSSRRHHPTFPFSGLPDHACDSVEDYGGYGNNAGGGQLRHAIPHIVHYVWLLKDPAEFCLSFKFFVSAYAAHILWRPERIYIHTDAAPETLARARTDGSVWTRRILAIPEVTTNFIIAPQLTSKGVAILHMEHKADFLRMDVLRQFGGVYLDVDAVPLRDISGLLNSGFANVVGGAVALSMKHTGYINNGVMMSVPNSTLMGIYYHAAHEFFEGSWATASIFLLTDIASRLVPLASEVLILHPEAFAPTSWEMEDQVRLFKPQFRPQSVTAAQGNENLTSTCRNAVAWLRQREGPDLGGGSGWLGSRGSEEELDFSSSYVLHAFDDQIGQIRGWNHKVDVRYVLARESNYARAVYPTVWHAVQAGIIPWDEI